MTFPGTTSLSFGDFNVSAPASAWTGTVSKMDKDIDGYGRIWVDTDLPLDGSLIGEEIVIENDGQRNACYTIHEVKRDGELTVLSLGDVCFVRDFADPNDYSDGHVYNFEEGAPFAIPAHIWYAHTNAAAQAD